MVRTVTRRPCRRFKTTGGNSIGSPAFRIFGSGPSLAEFCAGVNAPAQVTPRDWLSDLREDWKQMEVG